MPRKERSRESGSLGFENEKARPFDNDISLTLLRPEIPIEETPLASLSRRSPSSDTDFKAQIMLDKATDNLPFYGVTILYWDAECSKNFGAKWASAVGTTSFKDYTKALQGAVKNRGSQVRGRRIPL